MDPAVYTEVLHFLSLFQYLGFHQIWWEAGIVEIHEKENNPIMVDWDDGSSCCALGLGFLCFFVVIFYGFDPMVKHD